MVYMPHPESFYHNSTTAIRDISDKEALPNMAVFFLRHELKKVSEETMFSSAYGV